MPEIPRQRTPETAYRFAVQNGVVEQDLMLPHGREVIYGTGTAYQEVLRARLEAASLILGKAIESAPGHNAYSIPPSARPLSFEGGGIEGSAPYTYGDRELMQDLGRVTARITEVTDGYIIAGPSAEKAFVLTEFVRPGEERLGAAPGIEQCLIPAQNPTDTLAEQMSAFSSGFGDRFIDAAEHFRQGYQAAQVPEEV